MKKAERHKSWWAGGGRLETTGLDPPTVMNSKRDRPSPLSKGPPALQQTSTEEGGRGRPDEASDPAPLKPFDTKAQDPNYSDEPTLSEHPGQPGAFSVAGLEGRRREKQRQSQRRGGSVPR